MADYETCKDAVTATTNEHREHVMSQNLIPHPPTFRAVSGAHG